MHSIHSVVKGFAPRFLPLILLAFLGCCPLFPQQKCDRAMVDKETLQRLMKRIDQLEARVKELEADKQRADAATASPSPNPTNLPSIEASVSTPQMSGSGVEAVVDSTTDPASPSDSEQTQPDNFTTERLDLSRTLLRIRGFGDVSLHGDTMKGGNTTGDTTTGDTSPFNLGQLDLFITSDISEKFKFLADILFEGGPDKTYGPTAVVQDRLNVDVERYLLHYSHNDYLNISVGREHASIGYYSTAYQHSTWLQTATGRPFLYEFEDRGGILPIHMLGVSASGQLPSGSLGLHYVAEVGNGRGPRNSLGSQPLPNEIDDERHTGFNVALFARPDALPGFQTGFSFYRDNLPTTTGQMIGETIVAAHAVLIRPKYEWLNEALLDRQTPRGTSSVFNTPGFYSQFSRQYGSYRPYFRYQYVNVANNEPVFPDVALRHGPSAGLRYDATESVALKFQYDYTFLRSQAGIHGVTGQVGFTF
jgi:hypothetical protein